MPARYRSALLLFLSCVGMGSLPPLIELVFSGLPVGRFALNALAGTVYATCIAVPCALIIPRVLCMFRESSPARRISAVGGVLMIFAVAGCLTANVILAAVGLVPVANFGRTFWWSLRICMMMNFTFGVLTTMIATLQQRLVSTRNELHLRQIAEERERKVAAEARFASLESRVHPHFLFNTLNSISALVREDPAEAERMIERLSALLRFSLDSELAGLVTLREELSIVRDYLEIERVRFGARLRYRIETVDSTGDQLVPALSVQTLVENSVKYAVGARREGAEIVILTSVHAGRLLVEVSDDGPGFEAEAIVKPGHGLDLLTRRLDALFGSSARLEMSMANGRTLFAMSLTA